MTDEIKAKFIAYAKKWWWPHADSYNVRLSKKGRCIITVYHDNTFGDSDVNERVFTDEEIAHINSIKLETYE